MSDLESRVAVLEETVAELKALLEAKKSGGSKNSTPKVKPSEACLEIEDFLAKSKEAKICAHYYNTGENKEKFCACEATKFDGVSLKDLTKKNNGVFDVKDEDLHKLKCTRHATAKRDNGKKVLQDRLFNQGEKKTSNPEVASADEAVTNILGGTAEGAITPTAAKKKKPSALPDNFISVSGSEFVYSFYEAKDGNYLVCQHKTKKDGTPTTRPSPVVIGYIGAEPSEGDDFFEDIKSFDEEDYEKELNALNMKCKMLNGSSKPSVKQDDLAEGLTLPKVQSSTKEENYQTNTDTDSDINDLLDRL